jgi:hypothetical protein
VDGLCTSLYTVGVSMRVLIVWNPSLHASQDCLCRGSRDVDNKSLYRCQFVVMILEIKLLLAPLVE